LYTIFIAISHKARKTHCWTAQYGSGFFLAGDKRAQPEHI